MILCSRDAHVSLQKAASVMGLPADALQQLPVDEDGRLCPQALAEAIGPCASGFVLAVVATAEPPFAAPLILAVDAKQCADHGTGRT